MIWFSLFWELELGSKFLFLIEVWVFIVDSLGRSV